VGDAAAAIAYYGITALPAVILSTLGLAVVVGGQGVVDALVEQLGKLLPTDALNLVRDSLARAADDDSGVIFVVIGIAIALWTATGAMQAVMRGLNRAFGVEETRGAIRRRLAALAMLAFAVLAVVVTLGVLTFGPLLSSWLGRATDLESVVQIVWWSVKWPVAIAGLAVSFSGLLYFGPNLGEERRWPALSVGAVVAVLVWIAVSLLFALYVSHFGSYNKAWGSLSAVIVTAVWMWLSAVALLLGAEVDAELRRRRQV
jgi:membrane protein